MASPAYLVSGAAGFIGTRLVAALVAEGASVVGLVRAVPVPDPVPGVTYVPDSTEALAALKGPFASVIHLAQANAPFPVGGPALAATNVGLAVRLAEFAARHARTFVAASTGNVYAWGDAPHVEDEPLGPADFYGHTRAAAETLVRGYRDAVPVVLLRLFVPYGPGQTGRLIPKLAARIRGGAPIELATAAHPVVNPVYVSDVVRCVRQATALDRSAIVNVAGAEAVSIKALAEAIGEVLGCEPVFRETGRRAPGNLLGDTRRMHAHFGASTVPLAEGLARTFNRY